MKERQPHTKLHDETPKVRMVPAGGPGEPGGPKAVKTASSLPFRGGRVSASLRQRLGAVLLVAVSVAVIVAHLWPIGNSGGGDLTVVKGYGGELKVNFLTDREVVDILEDKYGLRVNIIPEGSIRLACGMPLGDDVDFVWLGDSVALARYVDRGCTMLRADNVYNSPVVLYSWAPVVDALVTAGVAETTADGAYTLDFPQLVDLMMAGTTWADIGLNQLHGRIVVQTTDPTRSNSGLLFAGMLANTLNGGDVVNTTTVTPLLPDMQAYFQRLGLMQPTSGDLFEQFLITGMGAKPIVALYESQIQEFLANNPSYSDQIRQQVRVLYPRPTVWASHPLVVRNENANRLLTALKDHDIQRLAWERHGQRPGVPGVLVNPEAIPVPGILPQVTSVTSMPALEVMDQILDEIVAPPDSATPKPTAAPLAPLGVLTLLGRAWLAPSGWLRRSLVRRVRLALHGCGTGARQLALLVVLLGLPGPGAVVAQDGGDVVVDVTVVFTAPYAPETRSVLAPSADSETLLVNGDDAVFVTNGDFDQPAQVRLDAFEGLNVEVDGLVSVDAGTSSDPMYWLDLFTIDDTPYGAFSLSRSGETGETITMFLGPVVTFAEGLAVAQQSVIVDGASIFDGVDPSGLQVLLDEALPGLASGAEPSADTSPTQTAPDESDAFADQPGMIGKGSYESPHHGFALTWTDDWTLDPTYDAPIASDVNLDFDEVHLTVDSPQWVWFNFFAGKLLPGVSFADFMDQSSSADRIALEIGPSAELVISRIGITADGDEVGALIIRVTVEGHDFLVYEEYRAGDDGRAVAALQLLMLVDDVAPGLEASESLSFEDGPVITLFTHDEILSAAQEVDML